MLGWARGLHIDDEGIGVGFSRLRSTKFRDNLAWVARGFRDVLPTRVAQYDLRARRFIRSVDLEPVGLSALFSILPAPTASRSPEVPSVLSGGAAT